MLIQQRERSDCAICTIAMALSRSYDEVREQGLKTGSFDPAKGTRSEYTIIEQFGLEQMVDFRILHRGVLAPEFFRHFAWGRRAILSVPSLNIEGGFHSVFWAGSELFDPCTRETYTHWNELKPDAIILFAERGPHPRFG